MEILRGNFLINLKEEAVISNELFRDYDYVALYFSASWCPPCQTFLPLLKEAFGAAQERQIQMQIIFVSSDSDNQRMTRFFMENHGPWFALPIGPTAALLRKKMQVYSIPQVVVMTNKGKVITKNGKEDIESSNDPFAMWFPDRIDINNNNEP